MITVEDKNLIQSLKAAVETVNTKYVKTDADIEKLNKTVDSLIKNIEFNKNKGSYRTRKAIKTGGWQKNEDALAFVTLNKAISLNDEATIKTLSVGVDADGGYTVNPTFSNTLIRMIDAVGIVRNLATVITMPTPVMKMPSLEGTVLPYWVDENALITESQPSFGQYTLEAKKLCALVPASAEILADSTIDIANLIGTLVAEVFAGEEDRVCLVGDVDSGDPFNGIVNTLGVTQVNLGSGTLFTNLDWDDFLNMQSEITDAARQGALYMMHNQILNVARKIKGDDGHYIATNPVSGPSVANIWEYPSRLCEKMPSITTPGGGDSSYAGKPFVIFGNFKRLIIGEREGMSIMKADQLLMRYDQLLFRYKRRLGILVILPSAFSVLFSNAA